MKTKLFFTMGCLLATMQVWAQEFTANNNIYYRIISEADKTVEIMNQDSVYNPTFTNSERSIIIPETVEYERNGHYTVVALSKYAFTNCRFSEITLPKTITSIGDEAFRYCTNIKSINVDEENKHYISIDGVLFNKEQNTLLQYPAKKEDVAYVVPNKVTTIASVAFYGCANLKEITLSNNLTEIKDRTFSSCQELTKIVLPEKITSIGNQAFYYCSNLSEVTLSENITSIGEFAFSRCDSLNEIALPAFVSSVTGDAFSNCSNLSVIKVHKDNKHYTITDGVLFNINKDTLIYYPAGKNETSYIIPSGTKVIGRSAFSRCIGLTNIEFPNEITTIGNYAFNNCTGLTEIKLPNELTTIENHGFAGCSFANITFPEKLKSIGDNCFSFCRNLVNITFSEGLKSIGNDAFAYTGIKKIEFPQSLTSIGERALQGCEELTEVVLPKNLKVIESFSFYRCSKLIKITFPTALEVIKNSAFSRCPDLIEVVLPKALTTIGEMAFYDSPNLAKVTLPESLTTIEDYAFLGCSALTEITCYNPNPINIEIGAAVFPLANTENCTLRVPNGSKALYAEAEVWKDFSNIIEFDPGTAIPVTEMDNMKVYSTVEGIAISGAPVGKTISVYNLSGVKLIQVIAQGETSIPLPQGAYIIQVGSKTVKRIKN